jgi:hypothetical protein
VKPRVSQLAQSGATTGQALVWNGTDWAPAAVTDAGAIPKTLVDAKGDLLAATANDTPARLPVGSNGQLLSADSTQSTGLAWVSGLTDPTTTKGDVLARSSSALNRLAVGSNGDVLTADSTQTLGVKWAAPSGGYTDPLTTKGDLVGRSSSATSRLAVGSDGQVLTADAASTLGVKWAAAGAGLVTVDDPALWTGSTTDDYEFNAVTTSLPSGWSWVNQGGATYNEQYGAGGLSVVGNASYNSRGLTRAEPSGSTYSAVFSLNYILFGSNNASGSTAASCGVFLRNSTSGKLVQFALFSSNNVGMELANSPTSYSSNSNLTSNSPWDTSMREILFRIKKNSTTSYDFGLSRDGATWDNLVTAFNPTTHLTTTTDIGFYLNSSVTARTGGVSCNWLRVR